MLMDLSDEPISDPPEIWIDDNLEQHSGAYDSIETALKEAKLDSVWFQNKDRR